MGGKGSSVATLNNAQSNEALPGPLFLGRAWLARFQNGMALQCCERGKHSLVCIKWIINFICCM